MDSIFLSQPLYVCDVAILRNIRKELERYRDVFVVCNQARITFTISKCCESQDKKCCISKLACSRFFVGFVRKLELRLA